MSWRYTGSLSHPQCRASNSQPREQHLQAMLNLVKLLLINSSLIIITYSLLIITNELLIARPCPRHTAPPQIVCPRWRAPTIQTRDTVPAIKTTRHKFWYQTKVVALPTRCLSLPQLHHNLAYNFVHITAHTTSMTLTQDHYYTAITCHPNYLTLACLPPKHQRRQSTNTNHSIIPDDKYCHPRQMQVHLTTYSLHSVLHSH